MIYHCKLLQSKRLQYQGNTIKIKMAFLGLLRQQSRYFPMIFDLITSVTGTRSWMRSSESGTQIGTRMEREWNANGTQMEREWNANGTQMERIYERVPVAFRTRFLLGYF